MIAEYTDEVSDITLAFALKLALMDYLIYALSFDYYIERVVEAVLGICFLRSALSSILVVLQVRC